MFQIALCFTNEVLRTTLSNEIAVHFKNRDINVSITSYYSTKHMLRQGIKSLHPDIFLFDPSDEMGQTLLLARKLKLRNKHMTSFIMDDISHLPEDDLLCLQPVFSIAKNYREFGLMLAEAYEHNLINKSNFTYFIRPKFFSYPISNILYFASSGRQTTLVSTEDEWQFYRKLDSVEQQLMYKNGKFVRIHKSYLVNVHFISSFDKNSITLKNGCILSISNYQYYKNLQRILA